MTDINATLERHKERLLAIPGCTAVAIGNKIVAGRTQNVHSIVVFVKEKRGDVDPAQAVPKEIDGVPTDVVQREFDFRPTATNPFARFDPVIGGVSITSYEALSDYGTIGCFITAGLAAVPPVIAGTTYLLTNEHVVQVAHLGGDPRVIQPGYENTPPHGTKPPTNYAVGNYVSGQRDATHDCAITTTDRNWRNEVPNHPWQPGNRTLQGTANPALNDRVYKYGATTKHTVGIVMNTNFHAGNIQNAVYITGENNGLWCAGGDSGSVSIRYADDFVLALNFMADTNTPVRGGFSSGLAYDIASQMLVFGNAALA